MRVPNEAEALRIWEEGARATPAQRAVALLASAFPDASLAEVADLGVGHRDGLLIRLRAACSGHRLAGEAACPVCGVRVEFDLDAAMFLVGSATGGEGRIEVGSYTVDFRTLQARDLLRVSAARGVEEGHNALVQAAVLQATFERRPVHPLELPDEVVEALGEAVAELDPQSDLLLGTVCPECGTEWQAWFDPASFLYREVSLRAQRTLGDIHLLARAYGWHESEILTMNPARRRAYLEMASA